MSIFKDNKLEKEKIEKEVIEQYEKNREQQIISRYEEDYAKSQKAIKPFGDILAEVVGTDTYIEFQKKTDLSSGMLYNLKKWVNRDRPSSKGTIVSVCVGYNVGLQIAEELLRSQGSSFNPHSKVDSAYVMLLTECRGKTVEECNKLLEEIGIKKSCRLGVCTRKPRKVTKSK